ncbi:MAG: hypothetical protein AAFW88_10910, partial [Pseudomonadota bacterium]
DREANPASLVETEDPVLVGRGTVKPWFARLLAAAYASDGPSASQDLATAEVLAAALPPAQEAA